MPPLRQRLGTKATGQSTFTTPLNQAVSRANAHARIPPNQSPTSPSTPSYTPRERARRVHGLVCLFVRHAQRLSIMAFRLLSRTDYTTSTYTLYNIRTHIRIHVHMSPPTRSRMPLIISAIRVRRMGTVAGMRLSSAPRNVWAQPHPPCNVARSTHSRCSIS